MRSRSPLLTSNALIQRVRRHRAMATLYRSDVDDVVAFPQFPATPMPDQDRAAIPKASLVPPGSNLPVGRVLDIADGMRPALQADLLLPAPGRGPLPIQPQRIQRQERTSDQIQASPEQPVHKPSATTLPETSGEKPSQDEGFDWISDRQWAALKTFMEGHQEKLARETAGQEQADLQMAPEEKAQREARERAQAELTRRQELARSGHLPRAKIEYVSGETSPGESGASSTGEVSQRTLQEPDDIQAEAPRGLLADEPTLDNVPGTTGLPDDRSMKVSEPAPKSRPQKTTIEGSKSPLGPAQSVEVDQTQQSAPDNIQGQLDEVLQDQRKPVESQGIDLGLVESSIIETETDEEMEDLSSSRPLEPELDLPAEISAVGRQLEVTESAKQAESKPSTIRLEPTSKSREVESAKSQQVIGIDQQGTSLSTDSLTEPSGEQKPPSLGRRLLDAARSLLGREEQTPESVGQTEELPAEPPVDSPTASAGRRVQRQTSSEELADKPSGIAGKEPASLPETFATEEPADEAIDIGEESSQVASTEKPAQIQAIDQGAAKKTEGPQVVADVVSKTEVTPPQKEEDILSQDQTGEAIHSTSEPVGGEKQVQRAEPATERMDGVFDKPQSPRFLEPAFKSRVEEQEDDAGLESSEPADEQTISQTLPLQKAWSVQEVQPPKDLPPSMTRSSEDPKPGITAQRKSVGDDAYADVVHKATKDVKPGKQTDSSIELVTPRKPRPSHPLAPKTGPDVQRKPPESRQADFVILAPAETTTPELPKKKPYLIPTEIGDLPSDLWQMLGEKPPEPQEKGLVPRPLADTTAAPAVQMLPETNGAPAQVVEMPSPIITQEFPIPMVQRAVRVEELETSTESESGESESAQAPEIDVDQLAKEVFSEIKRRLKVEWERGRGRF